MNQAPEHVLCKRRSMPGVSRLPHSFDLFSKHRHCTKHIECVETLEKFTCLLVGSLIMMDAAMGILFCSLVVGLWNVALNKECFRKFEAWWGWLEEVLRSADYILSLSSFRSGYVYGLLDALMAP
jgi:hypothetical protein